MSKKKPSLKNGRPQLWIANDGSYLDIIYPDKVESFSNQGDWQKVSTAMFTPTWHFDFNLQNAIFLGYL